MDLCNSAEYATAMAQAALNDGLDPVAYASNYGLNLNASHGIGIQAYDPKTGQYNSYNYLFSFQKRWDSDQKKTIGFFEAGAANNPVNTAYLQIDKSFNDAAAKGWSLSFDFNDATGIRQPETVDGGGDCYTLQGIRMKKPATKGVYIVNGKKVIR